MSATPTVRVSTRSQTMRLVLNTTIAAVSHTIHSSPVSTPSPTTIWSGAQATPMPTDVCPTASATPSTTRTTTSSSSPAATTSTASSPSSTSISCRQISTRSTTSTSVRLSHRSRLVPTANIAPVNTRHASSSTPGTRRTTTCPTDSAVWT